MQCSAILLDKKIKAYCAKHNKSEYEVWQEINARYLKQEERNILWEKEQDERSRNCKIEEAQAFAERNLVNRVFRMLDEWENIG